jgi:hypothetical protein
MAVLPNEQRFDTILYIDVLEHIQDDHGELRNSAAHIRPGGHVVVLAPAHQKLYSAFDHAIGHFRRYDRATLLAAAPGSLQPVTIFYLDTIGVVVSLANRWLLRASTPTHRQVMLWDRVVVPISRVVDPMLGRRVGKSVVAIWTHRDDLRHCRS